MNILATAKRDSENLRTISKKSRRAISAKHSPSNNK